MIELSQYFLINYLLLSCFSTWKLILAPSKVYHYNELCFLDHSTAVLIIQKAWAFLLCLIDDKYSSN